MIPMLCDRLKERRTKLNLTQKEVAEKLKISQSTYAGYESGKSQPGLDMLIKIADIYDTSLEYLSGRVSRTGF